MNVPDTERLAGHLAALDRPLNDLTALRYCIRDQVDAKYLAELDGYIGQLTGLRYTLWNELIAAQADATETEREQTAHVFYGALAAESRAVQVR